MPGKELRFENGEPVDADDCDHDLHHREPESYPATVAYVWHCRKCDRTWEERP